MNNFDSSINFYGTHKFTNILEKSFTSESLIVLIILFIICFFISKQLSKKTFKINNLIFLGLLIVYIILSVIKAYNLSKLPPHNLLKDMCGVKFDIVIIVESLFVPVLYTIIILAKLGNKIIKGNHKKNKENKGEKDEL